MKNILLMIQNLSNGGAEKAITLLANTLKDDYNVTMVAFDNRVKEYIPKVNVIDLKLPESKNTFIKIINTFRRIIKVRKIKKQLKIDYSISYLSGPNMVNCLSKYKDKTIISIRNIQSKLKKDYFREIANKISLKKANKIVCVSKAVEEDVKKTYSINDERLITIHNMIDIDEVFSKGNEDVKEKIFYNNNNLKIINIGRLIPQKGQWHLIKAFKIIKEKYTKAELIILGRGELEVSLKNLIEILDLKNSVHLYGFVINPYKYLYNSSIFVSTSNYEGMTNVILEAMACDLPIIATDCIGGTKEILSPKTRIDAFVKEPTQCEYGVLIPTLTEKCDFSNTIFNDEKMLAKAIISLIENSKEMEHYKKQSQIRIKDFETKKIKESWKKLLS